MLRAGVVGVGYLGQFHAEKYASIPGVQLSGVVDSDPARAEQIANKLNTSACSTIEELIGKVDAVSIAVPTIFHYDIAKRFLSSGIHVLLEKPMTVTLEQADDLIALAREKNLVLQVGHIERFNPAVVAIKPLIKSPKYIQSERSAPFTVRCTDVNVVLDLMIHDLDIVVDLAGSQPKELSASGASVITRGADAVIARIVFENGCIADVAASRISDEKKRILRVFDGNVVYTADYQTQKAFASHRVDKNIPEFASSEIYTERRDTLMEEIKSFLNHVKTGTRPLVSGIEGKKALALALLITETVERGAPFFVKVNREEF